ncbi:MAG: hypothetical protein ACTHXO_00785 [Actinomycetaceae bacterium]
MTEFIVLSFLERLCVQQTLTRSTKNVRRNNAVVRRVVPSLAGGDAFREPDNASLSRSVRLVTENQCEFS